MTGGSVDAVNLHATTEPLTTYCLGMGGTRNQPMHNRRIRKKTSVAQLGNAVQEKAHKVVYERRRKRGRYCTGLSKTSYPRNSPDDKEASYVLKF